MGSQGAAEKIADPSGPAQHRASELLGVCREVNYLTGPVGMQSSELHAQRGVCMC